MMMVAGCLHLFLAALAPAAASAAPNQERLTAVEAASETPEALRIGLQKRIAALLQRRNRDLASPLAFVPSDPYEDRVLETYALHLSSTTPEGVVRGMLLFVEKIEQRRRREDRSKLPAIGQVPLGGSLHASIGWFRGEADVQAFIKNEHGERVGLLGDETEAAEIPGARFRRSWQSRTGGEFGTHTDYRIEFDWNRIPPGRYTLEILPQATTPYAMTVTLQDDDYRQSHSKFEGYSVLGTTLGFDVKFLPAEGAHSRVAKRAGLPELTDALHAAYEYGDVGGTSFFLSLDGLLRRAQGYSESGRPRDAGALVQAFAGHVEAAAAGGRAPGRAGRKISNARACIVERRASPRARAALAADAQALAQRLESEPNVIAGTQPAVGTADDDMAAACAARIPAAFAEAAACAPFLPPNEAAAEHRRLAGIARTLPEVAAESCLCIARGAPGSSAVESLLEGALTACAGVYRERLARWDFDDGEAILRAIGTVPRPPPELVTAARRWSEAGSGGFDSRLAALAVVLRSTSPTSGPASVDSGACDSEGAKGGTDTATVAFAPRRPLFAPVSHHRPTIPSQTLTEASVTEATMTAVFFDSGRFLKGPLAGRTLVTAHVVKKVVAWGHHEAQRGEFHRFAFDGKTLTPMTALSDEAQDDETRRFVAEIPDRLGLLNGPASTAGVAPPMRTPKRLPYRGACLTLLDRALEVPAGGVLLDGGPPGRALSSDGRRAWLRAADGTAASYYHAPPRKLVLHPDGDAFRCDEEPSKGDESVLDTVRFVEEGAAGPLVALGTFAALGTVYAPKDLSNRAVAEMRRGWVESYEFGRGYAEREGWRYPPLFSAEEFLARPPAIFWRNPLGQLLMCANTLFDNPQLAEPVVYLYPPEPTDVRVELDASVRVSASRPPLRAGVWRVRAGPDGTLRDLDGSGEHPFLFWEGRSWPIPEPLVGDVVERSALAAFFDRALADRGLIPSEISDFKSFWLPRMSKKPFYLVRFFDETHMEFFAPLRILPRPDSFIRVLMDYKALEGRISAPPGPPARRGDRRGFTAVEWGGILR